MMAMTTMSSISVKPWTVVSDRRPNQVRRHEFMAASVAELLGTALPVACGTLSATCEMSSKGKPPTRKRKLPTAGVSLPPTVTSVIIAHPSLVSDPSSLRTSRRRGK
jgi:hypothetical protein